MFDLSRNYDTCIQERIHTTFKIYNDCGNLRDIGIFNIKDLFNYVVFNIKKCPVRIK